MTVLITSLYSFILFFYINDETVKNASLSKEQLLYFKETAFFKNELNRWEKTILLEIKGKPTPADLAQLDALVHEINPYLGNTQIKIVKNNGNLLFHFESDLSQFDENPVFKGEKIPLGFMKPILNAQHQFIKADVFINPSIIAHKRNEVLRHEFCHSLGLMSHSYQAFGSVNLLGKTIFKDIKDYEKSIIKQNLPILDKMAIKFLYHDVKSLHYSKKDLERDFGKLKE